MNLLRDWRGKVKTDPPPKPPQKPQKNTSGGAENRKPPPVEGQAGESELRKALDRLKVDVSDDELEELLYSMSEGKPFEPKTEQKPQEKSSEEQGDEEDEEEEEKYSPPSQRMGRKNSFKKAPSVYSLLTKEELRKRRLMNMFALIVSKVSEDLSGFPTEGDDEWDIKAISERKITKRKLSHCRQSRDRERVVLILDTSGSCEEYSEFYQEIAQIAIDYGDIEMYEAPNASVCSKYNRRTRKFEQTKAFIDSHNGLLKTDYGLEKAHDEIEKWSLFRSRRIIFFGDFDGTSRIVDGSLRNKVYWFSPVDGKPCVGDFVESLPRFKGKYFGNCQKAEDLIRIARKVR